jgi:hypothetical protein
MSLTKSLSPDEKIKAGTLGTSMTRLGLPIGVVLLVLSIILGYLEHDHFKRFQYGALTAWMLIFTLCLGSLFFVMIHHLAKAKWSTVLLRVAENVSTAFPLVAVLGLVFLLPMLVLDNHQLYCWDYWHHMPKDMADDESFRRLHEKASWLSSGAFVLRYAVYMAIYSGLALWFARTSRKQDETGDPRLNDKMRVVSGPMMLLFGMTTVFAGFDLEMSLSPEWYSTIFSVNMFGGAMVGTYAFLALLTRSIQKSGKLQKAVTVEHYHDLGKLLFGFNFFWAYTAFSPLLLIWYSNIPEEVVWYRYRWAGTDWQYFTIAIMLLHWLIPYVLLMSRWTKRILPVFMVICVEQLFFHYVDLYWNVMPNMVWGDNDGLSTGPLTGPLSAHDYHFAASDLLSLIAFFALFLAAVGSRMKGNLVPVKNPTLGASLAFENY